MPIIKRIEQHPSPSSYIIMLQKEIIAIFYITLCDFNVNQIYTL